MGAIAGLNGERVLGTSLFNCTVMGSAVAVDRCVCHQVSFARLIELASRHGYSLEMLIEYTRCGTGCGACLPYIEQALESGIADLPIHNVVATHRLISDKDNS